jgi:hypothetical protein
MDSRVLAAPQEVDVGCSFERDQNGRYAVLVEDEFAPVRDFAMNLVCLEIFDPDDFHWNLPHTLGAKSGD